ncbi:MAG: hypothetical protein DRP08_00430 [Candidatus Aenigmatarchaeota archaeon]|nr:MAG: hypothetical protein DRP08_00430 [Candidatus Aenigmarchaeota archaeon]
MNIYIETYGCAANQSDSEIMAGLLSKAGFDIVHNIELADIIIINTCVVKGTTERKILFRIKELAEKNKKLIIAGCMPETELDKIRKITDASVIGTDSTKILSVVRRVLNNEHVIEIGTKSEKVCLPKIMANPVRDIVQISEGCLSLCSFCLTRMARKNLFSYSPEKIIREINEAHSSGVKEFWLTSQDCGCYGFDIGTTITNLLKKITTEVRGKYRIRVGMMNPQHILNQLNELVEIYKDAHIFKFLHIPVQSGSDSILKDMKRGYSVNDFLHTIKRFRQKIPDITLWTDVIVGYPTETDDDFSKTTSLIKKIMPDYTNISRFTPRPHTKAAGLKQLPSETKKQRSRAMTELVNKICLNQNRRWVGKECEILIDEYNRHHRTWIGRTAFYKQVVVKASEKSTRKFHLGDWLNVKITDAAQTHLVGEVI